VIFKHIFGVAAAFLVGPELELRKRPFYGDSSKDILI